MTGILHNNRWKWSGFSFGLLFMLGLTLASITLGYNDISFQTSYNAFFQFNSSTDHLLVIDVRFPRAIIALVIGWSLGVAGVMLQSLTRNPLADLSIFGINAGAAFFVVCAITFFSATSLSEYSWFSFFGATLTGILVYLIGQMGREGMTPVNLTLAGAAVTALFTSATHGLLIINKGTLDEVIFWLAGSVADRDLNLLESMLPLLFFACVLAWILAKPVQTLLLGEQVAKGLGQRTWIVKLLVGLVIILLAGGTVSVVGPIGFVGLISPHIARYLVGNQMQWMVIYGGIIGAVLLICADVISRFIATPTEIPIGIMTALIGIPFFIVAARKEWREQ